MNKYLEKIAQLHPLEEGVKWDDKKKEVTVTPARVSQHLNRRANAYGILGAVEGGVWGAAIGATGGFSLASKAKPGSYLRSRYNGAGKVGAGIGAALLGAGGFAMRKSFYKSAPQKKLAKEELLGKMETKHQDAIDRIEGWDKH